MAEPRQQLNAAGAAAIPAYTDSTPPPLPPPATGLRPAAEDQARPLTEVTVTAGQVSVVIKDQSGLKAVTAEAMEAFKVAYDRHQGGPHRTGQYS